MPKVTGTKRSLRLHPFGFGAVAASGGRDLTHILGGKGANLAEMVRLGIPVPPGFTIPCAWSTEFFRIGRRIPSTLKFEVERMMTSLEKNTGKKLGDPKDPLLVSVRSGSPRSMPGMMDTILNLGLSSSSVQGLASLTGDERFAWDSYRRFIQMFSSIAMGCDPALFASCLDTQVARHGLNSINDFDVEDTKEVVHRMLAKFEDTVGFPFPQDPKLQLFLAIAAVFRSWKSERACVYRDLNGIPEDLGTAVNIQAMVFGNRDDKSATGVVFTRNPSTGVRGLYGDFLINAQGEDVVAGIRTPEPISDLSLHADFSELYNELLAHAKTLEKHYRDMCDIEFTIEQGKLWILQTRVGKRTAQAAVRIAKTMVSEKLISKEEAVARIPEEMLTELSVSKLNRRYFSAPIATGAAASPGAICGYCVFDQNEIDWMINHGYCKENLILVRPETDPSDLPLINQVGAILTSLGGKTSHAAVVAREMGIPAVTGVSTLDIQGNMATFHRPPHSSVSAYMRYGISLDGSTGEVFWGLGRLTTPKKNAYAEEIIEWRKELEHASSSVVDVSSQPEPQVIGA